MQRNVVSNFFSIKNAEIDCSYYREIRLIGNFDQKAPRKKNPSNRQLFFSKMGRTRIFHFSDPILRVIFAFFRLIDNYKIDFCLIGN